MQQQPTVVKKKYIVIGLAILFVIVAYNVYKSFQFHLVSTDPGKTNVATLAPYLQFNFNKQLVASSVKPAPNNSLYSSYNVSGKSIRFELKPPLKLKTKYTINMQGVTDTSGKKINITYTFTPKYIDPSKLTKEQKAALNKQDTVRPASRNNYAYPGIDTFIDDGLSTTQVEDLKQALFLYVTTFPNVKNTSVTQFTISNISITPFNPKGTSGVASADFTLALNTGQTYAAHMTYHDLTAAQLFLYQNGKLIYNSGDLDLQADPSGKSPYGDD